MSRWCLACFFCLSCDLQVPVAPFTPSETTPPVGAPAGPGPWVFTPWPSWTVVARERPDEVARYAVGAGGTVSLRYVHHDASSAEDVATHLVQTAGPGEVRQWDYAKFGVAMVGIEVKGELSTRARVYDIDEAEHRYILVMSGPADRITSEERRFSAFAATGGRPIEVASTDLERDVWTKVCEATNCLSSKPAITVYRDAEGQLSRIQSKGDRMQCSHVMTTWFDAAGERIVGLSDRPGAGTEADIASFRSQSEGLVEAESLPCPPR